MRKHNCTYTLLDEGYVIGAKFFNREANKKLTLIRLDDNPPRGWLMLTFEDNKKERYTFVAPLPNSSNRSITRIKEEKIYRNGVEQKPADEHYKMSFDSEIRFNYLAQVGDIYEWIGEDNSILKLVKGKRYKVKNITEVNNTVVFENVNGYFERYLSSPYWRLAYQDNDPCLESDYQIMYHSNNENGFFVTHSSEVPMAGAIVFAKKEDAERVLKWLGTDVKYLFHHHTERPK